MNPFKRLCLIIFGLAGIFCLIALAMPWFGPYQAGGAALMGQQAYYVAVEACLAITALGVLIAFLRALFTPRNRKAVIVSKAGGDQITVTRDAIASQAKHLIEEDGLFEARHIDVRLKKKGHVRVAVRVQPGYVVDVVSAGQRLHETLVSGLQTVCGDNVDSVDIEFVDAENHDGQDLDEDDLDMSSFQESYEQYKNESGKDGAGSNAALEAAPGEAGQDGASADAPSGSSASGASADAADPDTTQTDITVPMGRTSHQQDGQEGEE